MYQRVHTGFTGVYVRGVYDLPVHTLDKLREHAQEDHLQAKMLKVVSLFSSFLHFALLVLFV